MLVNGDIWEWVWDRFSSISSVPALAAAPDTDARCVYSLCDVINVISVFVNKILSIFSGVLFGGALAEWIFYLTNYTVNVFIWADCKLGYFC